MTTRKPILAHAHVRACTVSVALGGALLGGCAAPSVGDPNGETLELTRLDNGNLEYCDAAGVCTELPYGGACAVVNITIDTTTGRTCESCLLPDGTHVDHGCDDASVACVLVTVPEPDCVVCAYVDGSVIYSSCVADDGPVPACRTDADCPRGTRCVAGVCEPAYPTCADVDCPPGTRCEMQDVDCITWPCPPVPACIPEPPACSDDRDCGPGEECLVMCWDCIPEDPHCVGGCRGECVPSPEDPCDRVKCAEGEHCELVDVDCITWPCDPVPECVPDASGCLSDADCGEGETCVAEICPAAPCAYDEETGEVWCPPCYGQCVPGDGCVVTGCSAHVCADDHVITTCEWRPSYACYEHATCARQDDGACGWTMTDELRECLEASGF